MEPVSTDSQTNKYFLSWPDVCIKSAGIVNKIRKDLGKIILERELYVYGIPRGGIPVALLIKCFSPEAVILVTNPKDADVFVDDIIDSGATMQKYKKEYPNIPFYALYNKIENDDNPPGWLIFPWEQMTNESGPEENVRRVIEYIGEDPDREGLKETPDRVLKSWDTLYGGYTVNPQSVLKVFEDDSSDEMVILKDIEFYSTCEHHMLPFFGKAHIAYIPNGKVVGISKLARVLEVFARRLQIQERLCQEITKLLDEELKPLGSACILEAQHFCMTSRGVQKQHSIMTTSSLTGVFREKDSSRSELFQMIK
ncbi:MAG: GTP cyclohydrolase I FolE [Candidatus Heimdallarchaeaceae archaeon]